MVPAGPPSLKTTQPCFFAPPPPLSSHTREKIIQWPRGPWPLCLLGRFYFYNRADKKALWTAPPEILGIDIASSHGEGPARRMLGTMLPDITTGRTPPGSQGGCLKKSDEIIMTLEDRPVVGRKGMRLVL